MTDHVNTRDTPFVYDDAGHVIAGGDRVPLPGTDRVKAALKSGRLVELNESTVPELEAAPEGKTEEAA